MVWFMTNGEGTKRTGPEHINFKHACLKEYPNKKEFKFTVSVDDETIHSIIGGEVKRSHLTKLMAVKYIYFLFSNLFIRFILF